MNEMQTPPVTVLGIGNIVLQDEGFGVRVAEALQEAYRFPETVQVLDGGTLGMELLRFVTGTEKLLILDAVKGGGQPGSQYRFDDDAVMLHFQDKLSSHEIGIQDVLALLTVTGKKIPEVVVLGAEPFVMEAGTELTSRMAGLVPKFVQQSVTELKRWGVKLEAKN
jgi:hydrogenase maturation protease